jgi:hypothetical protein
MIITIMIIFIMQYRPLAYIIHEVEEFNFSPQLKIWREFLALSREMLALPSHLFPKLSTVSNTRSGGSRNGSGAMMGDASMMSISHMLPTVYQQFHRQFTTSSHLNNSTNSSSSRRHDSNLNPSSDIDGIADGLNGTKIDHQSTSHHIITQSSSSSSSASSYKEQQQDAQEFLTFLLDSLHEELVLLDKNYPSSINNNNNNAFSHPHSNQPPSSSSSSTSRSTVQTRSSSSTTTTIIGVKSLEDDWSVVGKATKVKLKVDTVSQQLVQKTNTASMISRLFYGSMRWVGRDG